VGNLPIGKISRGKISPKEKLPLKKLPPLGKILFLAHFWQENSILLTFQTQKSRNFFVSVQYG